MRYNFISIITRVKKVTEIWRKKIKRALKRILLSWKSIVSNLEQGDVELENVLAQFEEGLKIYKTCKTMLNEAEKKVKVLTDDLKEEDL
jgi:exodeoxyribonuclease VII small subunit